MGNLTINAVTLFLESVTKPQRYLGGEYNEIKKDWEEVSCRFLSAFLTSMRSACPIWVCKLYEAVNREPAPLMERAFSPGGYGGDHGQGRGSLMGWSPAIPCGIMTVSALPCSMRCAIPMC